MRSDVLATVSLPQGNYPNKQNNIMSLAMQAKPVSDV
ncbi:protein of unknown function [Sterolibacterium denitrificans]|uniref:Uncharacterized protein n=1 Tax=Sterolibacterium denitrificans TaxID=157592 RepID=A0A7Z7HSJ6_9PROT|nr:protein of unknown function [Sterolibacterium denitrificans]